MNSILKSCVVGLLITALTFSSALMGMAQAGGINFEGISLAKTDYTQDYEKQPRGIMFNFSFGAPKGYKKAMKLNGIPTSMLDESKDDNNNTKNIIVGVLVIAAGVGLGVLWWNKVEDEIEDLEIFPPPETE
jgi:hypothetical protein